jgi:hypothetical protein
VKRRGFFATSMWEDIKQELGILDKEDLHAHRLGLPDGSVRMRLDGRMVVFDDDEEKTRKVTR